MRVSPGHLTAPLPAGDDLLSAPASLLAGAPVQLLARLPLTRLAALGDAVGLLGAELELADLTVGDGARLAPGAPWLIEAGALLALPPAARERLRALTATAPALLFAADASGAADLARAGEALTGRPLPVTTGGDPGRLTFTSGVAALRPFDDVTLQESEPRVLPVLIDPDPRGSEPLIGGDRGAVLTRIAREDGGELWVTAAPPLERVPVNRILRRRFHSGNFLELLPLLSFLRHALGERAWRRPGCQAAFMIDDPNLRSDRYGWVDYRSLRDAGRRHGFHTSIAMAPVDTGKTRSRTAALFGDSPELSLVMHGVYHTRHEFAKSVSPARARGDLGFGLAAMEAHRRRHGIACPPVMTFPFSKCSSEWLLAMREVGLAAAVTGPNPFPFLADLTMLTDPAFAMLPAEMGHGGFPVLSRSFLTQQREDLLFTAWLGKPIIVYLHHEDLRRGLQPLAEVADFVNRRIGPEWTDLGAITAANYQVRRAPAGRIARLFSGRVELTGAPCAAALKPGADRHDDEHVWVDGRAAPVARVRGVGVLAQLGSDARTVVAGPVLTPAAGTRRPVGAGFAHGRRGLTELRDRFAPAVARLLGDTETEPSTVPAFTG